MCVCRSQAADILCCDTKKEKRTRVDAHLSCGAPSTGARVSHFRNCFSPNGSELEPLTGCEYKCRYNAEETCLSLGCYNKIPQPTWLNNHIFLTVLKAEVQDGSATWLGSGESDFASWLVLLAVSLCGGETKGSGHSTSSSGSTDPS